GAARGLRQLVGPAAGLPPQGRCRGQLGEALVAAQPLDLADGLHVELVTMRRRHLRGVLKIEAQVYPRPWSLGLFLSELALRSTRIYLVAKVGTTVVGYAGLMLTGTDGHVTTIA